MPFMAKDGATIAAPSCQPSEHVVAAFTQPRYFLLFLLLPLHPHSELTAFLLVFLLPVFTAKKMSLPILQFFQEGLGRELTTQERELLGGLSAQGMAKVNADALRGVWLHPCMCVT